MSDSATALQIDPRLLQRLKGIDLKSRFLVRGLYNNQHRTSDYGSSTEFVDHRDYRRGDEIRSIDWRAYARTGRFFVKRHEMESNMKVHFILDSSDSMRVSSSDALPSKLELATIIAGAVMMMVIRQQDSASLSCVSDQIDEHIPARQGNRHLSLLYQHLAAPKGSGGGAFGHQLGQLTERVGTRGIVFVLTDALDPPHDLMTSLKGMRVRELDVNLIHVLDRDEVEFPFDEMTEFRHPETGAKLVGNAAALRKTYLERFGNHLDTVERGCKKLDVDYLRVRNDDDLIKLLSLHFLRRLTG